MGGDYVFTVKSNQPGLHATCKGLPWKHVPARQATQTGHGRGVIRTIKVIKVVAAPDWITFADGGQIAQGRRTVTRGARAREKTVEVVYMITSADHHTAPQATLAAWVQGHWRSAWVQGHWRIENQLHWVRDVTYDEDDPSPVRTGAAPQVMATLRNTAISLLRVDGWTNIAYALRHHASHSQRVLDLLMPP